MATLRPLSVKTHAGLAWQPPKLPVLSKGQTSVPLAMREVVPLSVRLPFLFERHRKSIRAVVPLDLLASLDLALVDGQGRWITPFAPFALMTGPFHPMPQAGDETQIAVDQTALASETDERVPLYGNDGSLTEQTRAHLEQLALWRAGLDAVTRAAGVLARCGVLRRVSAVGHERYAVVDEARLQALGPRDAGELLPLGGIKLAYASIISLTTLNSVKKVQVGEKAAPVDPDAADFLAALREGFE